MRPAIDAMQRLRESRQELEERGLPSGAISVIHHHPDALEAVEAALAGEQLDAPVVEYGPRRGLRDGYASEPTDVPGREMVVVHYEPKGEWGGEPYGEKRRVIWTAHD
ncbi:MAG: hypothetical protein ABEN55_09905 [Bradymonadaceae bacterium]